MALFWKSDLNTIDFKNQEEIEDFFTYKNDNFFVISGHRGGEMKNYPENSIYTIKKVLEKNPAIFEVDAHLTKDNIPVMIHDATLDRTTTCIGKIKDFTLNEIKKCKLKDKKGNITNYNIDTLEDMIVWAKGKTIINLDVKDVSAKQKIDLVNKHNAFTSTIFTVHNAKQALEFYNLDKRTIFSAWILDEKSFLEYKSSGIPWKNIAIAYVGYKITDENKKLKDLLHNEDVMTMIAAAPIYDKIKDKKDRYTSYQNIIKEGFDILETDYPIDVAKALKSLEQTNTTKQQYINR
ncbi:glycerophosphodiester phosphodiesterase family protein [Aliarcobacter thereius]|nr:glycerophosphodiester phosphodiesterase family protein [Aliarcobacter thereius]